MGLKNLSYLAREISWLLKNEQPNTSSLDAAARFIYPLIFRDTFLVHKSILVVTFVLEAHAHCGALAKVHSLAKLLLT